MRTPDGYGVDTYGERIAGIYDELLAGPATGQVERLLELAGDRSVLELGIGTGRVALPLAARGVRVAGIDASTAMIEQLKTKPGSEIIPVTVGDFSDFDLGEKFGLVYVVCNTLFGLLSQAAQIACFSAVARHLRPGGRFVVEAFVPDPTRFERGGRVGATSIELDRVQLECSRHDPVSQRISSAVVMLDAAGLRLYPVEIRYAWPAELDLMGSIAGLDLEDRWAGWDRQPFTAASAVHVSVWRAPSV